MCGVPFLRSHPLADRGNTIPPTRTHAVCQEASHVPSRRGCRRGLLTLRPGHHMCKCVITVQYLLSSRTRACREKSGVPWGLTSKGKFAVGSLGGTQMAAQLATLPSDNLETSMDWCQEAQRGLVWCHHMQRVVRQPPRPAGAWHCPMRPRISRRHTVYRVSLQHGTTSATFIEAGTCHP